MFTRVQTFDFNTSYQSMRQYTSNMYRTCTVFINNNRSNLTNRLTNITTIGKEKVAYSYEVSKKFIFTHKHAIGAAAAVATALLVIKFFNRAKAKNIDQNAKPDSPVEEEEIEESNEIIIPNPSVTLNPLFQLCTARIEIPEIDLPPANVAIHFCIDASGSMVDNNDKENREIIVKQAINNILTHAFTVVESYPGTVIGLSIVEFRKSAQEVLPYTVVNQSHRDTLSSKIDSIQSHGGTVVDKGLKLSYSLIKKQQTIDKAQSQILILLTDAETENADEANCLKTIKSYTNLKAKFFAIGIGQGHKKKPLERLSKSCNGTYIDTSNNVNNIVPAVQDIFKASIAPFQNIILSNSKLPDNQWSLVKNINNIPQGLAIEKINNKNSPKTYNLGNLAHKERLDLKILISTHALEHAETTFCLSYTDPLGASGTFTFSVPLTVGTRRLNSN